MAKAQSGAEALVRSLIAGGVTTCFANPGTSEMHFVAALDRIPGIRCVPGLQENTVTGMADGYFRVLGRPAATLLHCGPGLANGIANLHNARRAESGVINITGDHALAHVKYDSPLTSDIAALAGASSDWLRIGSSADDIGADAARAISQAGAGVGHGRVATLVLPADVSWGEGGREAPAAPPQSLNPPDAQRIAAAVTALRSGEPCVIVLGTAALTVAAQPLVAAISSATGAPLKASGMVAVQPRGRGRLDIAPVPYPVDLALAALEPFTCVITIGCPMPTAFFLYPGKPSLVTRPDASHIALAGRDDDCQAVLAALAAALDSVPAPLPVPPVIPFAEPEGAITAEGFAETVCALIPDNAIVVNEALTLGTGFPARAGRTAPCDWLHITGGAIGGGIPVATGAAVAAPERRVITLQADGSAAYTMQALWTQAREGLNVLTLILNNRSYAILVGEYARVGASPGPTAMNMLSLERPAIDWAGLAGAMGVPGEAVTTLEGLRQAMRVALDRPGPCLLDVRFD